MFKLLSIISIIFFGFFLIVRYLESISVFFPSKNINATPAGMGLAYEDLYFTTADHVKINGWFVKVSDRAATIIFAHGNAGTMADRLMKIKFWHDLGLNILIFDYRGYGRSEGKPSEKGVYLDALSAYDYLESRHDINSRRIILYGASMGGAVMIELAQQRIAAALMVESTFTSAKDMAHRIYPFVPSFLMSIKFDSISKIDKIKMPILILHSREDETVPFNMGQALYQKALEPKEFIVIHGGHNEGALVHDIECKQQIQLFLQKYVLL